MAIIKLKAFPIYRDYINIDFSETVRIFTVEICGEEECSFHAQPSNGKKYRDPNYLPNKTACWVMRTAQLHAIAREMRAMKKVIIIAHVGIVRTGRV